jgi:hypothetical protein
MKPVYVYRNLKHGRASQPLYSIMQDGRVIDRRHRVLLDSATFVVREAGRQRVLTEGRKNVHAFVKGYLVDEADVYSTNVDRADLPVKVTYNPFKGPNFTVADGTPVTGAQAVLLNEHGITAANLSVTVAGINPA